MSNVAETAQECSRDAPAAVLVVRGHRHALLIDATDRARDRNVVTIIEGHPIRMRVALASAAISASAVTSELSGLSAKVAKPQPVVNSTRSAQQFAIRLRPSSRHGCAKWRFEKFVVRSVALG